MADTVTAQRLRRLQRTADRILARIDQQLEQTPELTPQTLKHYAGTLKDLRDIHLQQAQNADASAITVELGQELEALSE